MPRSVLKTAFFFLFVAPAFAELAAARNSAARMDEVVQSYVDAKQFMGSVLVARGETILFSKAYGSASLEWNIPNTTTTKFRIGSMTKQFTAAAVLLLEERGKLNGTEVIGKGRWSWDGASGAWHIQGSRIVAGKEQTIIDQQAVAANPTSN